ncbi:MAG: hemerythrin domain-containing protein, partial [Anaeromyxobacteraceae bacterium]
RAEEATLGPHLDDDEHARLVDEHRRLREHAAQLRAAGDGVTPEAAHATGALLDAHVRWEERELFPGCESGMDEAALETVGHELEKRLVTRAEKTPRRA